MKKIHHIGKLRIPNFFLGSKKENIKLYRKWRCLKSRYLKVKRRKNYFHEEFIPRTSENKVAQILSVDGLIVTFKTESGAIYKFDFNKTSKTDSSFYKKIKNLEYFNTIKVEKGNFAFMDKNRPVTIAYPDGDKEEIGYHDFYTIEDRMFLLEKVSE